ncbi:MAG: type 4a pilus biogenesis protein PilO [Acidobacteriota bacterium]
MDLRLNKLPWYAQVGVFAVIALAGVAAFYYLYVAPKAAELDTQRLQLEALRADINKGLSTARQLPQFRSEVADLETRLTRLKAVLPEEKDFGDLLRSLQTLATQSNLAIKVFKPGSVVNKQLHAEWPITMEFEGSYHNLGLFFDRISKFARIINIGNVSIRAKDKPEPNATIDVTCVATTFVLTDAGKTVPAVAKEGAQ